MLVNSGTVWGLSASDLIEGFADHSFVRLCNSSPGSLLGTTKEAHSPRITYISFLRQELKGHTGL